MKLANVLMTKHKAFS